MKNITILTKYFLFLLAAFTISSCKGIQVKEKNDPDYRVNMLRELVKHDRKTEAIKKAIEYLKDPSEFEIVKLTAVWCLGRYIDNPDALNALISALPVHSDVIRLEIIKSFERKGLQQAVAPLIEILKKDKNNQVKIYAVNALATIGDKSSVPVLIDQLKTDDQQLKIVVASALHKLTGVKTLENNILIKDPRKWQEILEK